MANVDFNSPYYPYECVHTGYNHYDGADDIPMRIAKYLLDLPDAAGYVPQDDNSRPRVRLMKYLYYDGARPLSQPLPTPEEKLSLLYDPDHPELNTDEEKEKHPLGYRILPQVYNMPADFRAKTTLKFYVGRELPYSPYVSEIGLEFVIGANYMQDGNMRTDALSRLWAMENALKGALHGVNIGGIGVVSYDRRNHMDNGSNFTHDDGTAVFRRVNMSFAWGESGSREI